MKASNYLAKLPQEATIKNIQAFRDYDLITLDVPAPRQRLCPHYGPTDCVGSPLFSGVSFNSTNFSQRTSCFSGVTQNLLLFPVYTSFFRSSPYFHGVSNENTSFSPCFTR